MTDKIVAAWGCAVVVLAAFLFLYSVSGPSASGCTQYTDGVCVTSQTYHPYQSLALIVGLIGITALITGARISPNASGVPAQDVELVPQTLRPDGKSNDV